MDLLFTAIKDLLDSIIPSGSALATEFATFNEFLAYVITLTIIWTFLLKPLLKILRLSPK